MKKKEHGFSGSIGFVLAAAGSAVGVGNIWRFPYLCAKDGGGLFLLVYLVLVLTFGFVLLTTDVAIGRKTKQNALNAYAALHKKWRFLGFLTFLKILPRKTENFVVLLEIFLKKGYNINIFFWESL